MTAGTINKTFILFFIVNSIYNGSMVDGVQQDKPIVPTIAGAIMGLILVVAASTSHNTRIFSSMRVEGLFIGGISAIFEWRYPGMVIQAVGATFVTFGVCLAYRLK
jgi:uncharacterized YccA/Bax inhibitor family protein